MDDVAVVFDHDEELQSVVALESRTPDGHFIYEAMSPSDMDLPLALENTAAMVDGADWYPPCLAEGPCPTAALLGHGAWVSTLCCTVLDELRLLQLARRRRLGVRAEWSRDSSCYEFPKECIDESWLIAERSMALACGYDEYLVQRLLDGRSHLNDLVVARSPVEAIRFIVRAALGRGAVDRIDFSPGVVEGHVNATVRYLGNRVLTIRSRLNPVSFAPRSTGVLDRMVTRTSSARR